MKKTLEICDACKRDCEQVDTHSKQGGGSLKFNWSIGGNGGGASGDIDFDDLCVECTSELRTLLLNFKKEKK